MNSYTYIDDLQGLVGTPQPDSITSRTFLKNEAGKFLVFAFDTGQELSEHTAARPAILHFLSGEAAVTLGGEQKVATAGTWVYMPAQLPHSIKAKTPLVLLLLLLGESS